jgi:sugar phosphate isomerase/epimerase
MRLAFSSLACPGWSVQDVADRAAAYGYEGVELRLIDGETFEPSMDRAGRERVKRAFRDAGQAIVGLGSSVGIASGEDGLAARIRAWLELASEWESPLVRVFGRAPGELDDETIARAAGVVEDALPHAERLGVAIGLETHDSFARSADVARVLARVPSGSFGAIWDTHHPHRMGETPREIWERIGARLLHVHVKDARRAGDGEWDLVLLGEGEVECREIVDLLRANGWDRWLAAEWEKKWHPEIAEPEVALPQHLAVLRDWTAA